MNIPHKIKPDIAQIQLLYIHTNQQKQIQQMVNACWFTHQLHQVNTKEQEISFFNKLPDLINSPAMYQAVFADFRRSNPLKTERRLELIDLLHQASCPLITLTDSEKGSIYDETPYWLHMSIPAKKIEANIGTLRETITNFWFCLPA